MYKNVLEWLESTKKVYPNKVAYEMNGNSITFAEVENISRKIGSGLVEICETKNPVGVILGKDIMTIVSFLGVVYSGKAYAPIDVELPPKRISSILGTLRPSVVLTNYEYKNRVLDILSRENIESIRVVCIEELINSKINTEKLCDIREKSVDIDPLYIIFTSGSSGTPKGVVTSHKSLMCYIDSYVRVMGITEKDVLGNQSPLDYIAAIRDIYIPLYKGASTVLISKKMFMQMEALSQVMLEKKITTIGWSTSAIIVLTTLGFLEQYNSEILKKICFSGSVMPGSILKQWQLKMPETKFVNQYGPTEATASCTYYEIEEIVDEETIIPIGKPYNNYRVFILNNCDQEAITDEIGEICVAGPILALGYYNDYERTCHDFIQNPLVTQYREVIYKTGDLGSKRSDGNIMFHGRKDRQVKYMGHRVELDEVESSVISIEGVNECSVYFNEQDDVLVLYYSGNISKKEITISLRNNLPGFMIPRKIININEIPKLPNGKVDMVSLKKRYSEEVKK